MDSCTKYYFIFGATGATTKPVHSSFESWGERVTAQ